MDLLPIEIYSSLVDELKIKMNISVRKITPNDQKLIELIAEWYLQEWNIAKTETIQTLTNFSPDSFPFQILMIIDDLAIATGGIYQHVRLLEIEPRFRVYRPWLALVYTIPEYRNLGYGTLLCQEIQTVAKELELKEIFLFTHTAENFYKRLNWQELERLTLNNKDIVVMKKKLDNGM